MTLMDTTRRQAGSGDGSELGSAPRVVRGRPGRWILFWGVALGGMAFDLATKTVIFARIGRAAFAAVIGDPRHPRTAHQLQSRGTVGTWPKCPA